MTLYETYLLKCKCGYEVEVEECVFHAKDKDNKPTYVVSSSYHCPKCGNLEQFSSDDKNICSKCGTKTKHTISFLQLLFPKLIKILPGLKCPKCGKKRLKLQVNN